MTNDEAMKLARLTLRAMQHEQSAVSLSWADVRRLCDYILSSSMKREIENAAFERAAQVAVRRFPRHGQFPSNAWGAKEIAKEVRALIQPPALKDNGE